MRRTTVTDPSARSRGPTSTRTGMPLSSASTARRPNGVSTRASSSARTPRATRSATTCRAAASTPSPSLTTMTSVWTGASRGGTRRPLSSPWHMMSPPSMRVERAPRRRPAQLLAALLGEVADVEGAGEVLPELVAGAHLQGLAVAHHALERQGVRRSGEALAGGLAAEDDRHREHLAHEGRIDLLVDALRVEAARPPRWRGRCAPPARGTRSCAGRSAGRSSHRTTLAHWLSSSGRSR